MSVAITRQETQTIVDQARNRIMERMVNRYEIQGAVDHARDRVVAHMYDLEQQRTRINAVQYEKQWQKMVALDNRMRSIEGELATLNQHLTTLLTRQNEIAGYTRRLSSVGNGSIAIIQRALQQSL